MSKEDKRPVAKSQIVLREEFDDWALLFDPDSGKAYGLNPVSVVIWKCLDGKHTIPDIVGMVKDKCKEVPEDVEKDMDEYIKELVDEGFAGYEVLNK